MTVAFLFPGLGSDRPGMGESLACASDAAHGVFVEAGEVLGRDPGELLAGYAAGSGDCTYEVQEAIFCVGVAGFRALRAAGVDPAFVAGHSLGETAAIVASGALDFADGLAFVRQRCQIMRAHGAGGRTGGAMTAIRGLEQTVVEWAVSSAARGDVLVVANENAPDNVVAAGEAAAVARLECLAMALGARRVRRLAFEGAFHSPMMAPVVRRVRHLAAGLPLNAATVPVVAGATALEHDSAEELRRRLAEQLVERVRWTGVLRRLADLGVDTVVEVGPSALLARLTRRTVPAMRSYAVHDAASLSEVAGMLAFEDRARPPAAAVVDRAG